MLKQLDAWNPYPPPPLPAELARLADLAYNLWWTWQPEAEAVFSWLDPALWRVVQHNPVALLRRLGAKRLSAAARDVQYRGLLARVASDLDDYLADENTPFARRYPALAHLDPVVAYFSAEFGIHESLPIYSGGLGILAGDHCKAASDLGLPLVGVGLMYPQGYFTQTLDNAGRQHAYYEPLHMADTPLRPAAVNGAPVVLKLAIAGQPLWVQVWTVAVGRVQLLLLDTGLPENLPLDREVGAKLYGGGPEVRLRQEMVLGLGGMMTLDRIGMHPPILHLNEGHAAFAPLAGIRQRTSQGEDFATASAAVAAGTLFTTHTPVKAGHDAFDEALLLHHFQGYPRPLGLDEDSFLALARREHEHGHGTQFSMTRLAFRLSGHHNAVSQLHGQVSRSMWQDLWPGLSADEVPIGAITNGVHGGTWLAPELASLVPGAKDANRRAGREVQDPTPDSIPDEPLWHAHMALKARLIDLVRWRERRRRQRLGWAAEDVAAADRLLDPAALTLGFARRFATYKRATLLFRDLERLAALLNHPERPVQLIVAGKAHPADVAGQDYLAEIYAYSQRPELAGRVLVVEGYDMRLARRLTQGVDVWLNTPRRPHEASGTSGMKAALNGVPNLSVLDGWWVEGYQGDNGWAISGEDAGSEEATDHRDAAELYRLLEAEVVPIYYDRVDADPPRAWLRVMRAAMAGAWPRFTAERMVEEYAVRYYLPALAASAEPAGLAL